MLNVLSTAALFLATFAPELPQERIEAVTAELRKVFLSGATSEKVAAIERASGVLDAKVIGEIAKGLRQDELEVKLATLRALRFMDHPEALESLERTYKRDRDIRKEPALYEALVKGIAQHGAPASIGLLTDFSLKDLTHQVMRARILGLGMIRERDSVAGLFAVMAKLGRRNVQPYMGDLRTALVVLVGEDHGGSSQDAWQRWWNANKKTLEVAPIAPVLPERMRQMWNRYWELSEEKQRPTKRGERGGDQLQRAPATGTNDG